MQCVHVCCASVEHVVLLLLTVTASASEYFAARACGQLNCHSSCGVLYRALQLCAMLGTGGQSQPCAAAIIAGACLTHRGVWRLP